MSFPQPPGRPYNVGDFHQAIGQAVQQLRGEFQEALNRTAGGLRRATADEVQRFANRVEDLSRDTASLTANRSGGSDNDVRYVKDIPGRRVPYVMIVDIPIGADET